MGKIIKFPKVEIEKNERDSVYAPSSEQATILIFTGIRYERIITNVPEDIKNHLSHLRY